MEPSSQDADDHSAPDSLDSGIEASNGKPTKRSGPGNSQLDRLTVSIEDILTKTPEGFLKSIISPISGFKNSDQTSKNSTSTKQGRSRPRSRTASSDEEASIATDHTSSAFADGVSMVDFDNEISGLSELGSDSSSLMDIPMTNAQDLLWEPPSFASEVRARFPPKPPISPQPPARNADAFGPAERHTQSEMDAPLAASEGPFVPEMGFRVRTNIMPSALSPPIHLSRGLETIPEASAMAKIDEERSSERNADRLLAEKSSDISTRNDPYLNDIKEPTLTSSGSDSDEARTPRAGSPARPTIVVTSVSGTHSIPLLSLGGGPAGLGSGATLNNSQHDTTINSATTTPRMVSFNAQANPRVPREGAPEDADDAPRGGSALAFSAETPPRRLSEPSVEPPLSEQLPRKRTGYLSKLDTSKQSGFVFKAATLPTERNRRRRASSVQASAFFQNFARSQMLEHKKSSGAHTSSSFLRNSKPRLEPSERADYSRRSRGAVASNSIRLTGKARKAFGIVDVAEGAEDEPKRRAPSARTRASLDATAGRSHKAKLITSHGIRDCNISLDKNARLFLSPAAAQKLYEVGALTALVDYAMMSGLLGLIVNGTKLYNVQLRSHEKKKWLKYADVLHVRKYESSIPKLPH